MESAEQGRQGVELRLLLVDIGLKRMHTLLLESMATLLYM